MIALRAMSDQDIPPSVQSPAQSVMVAIPSWLTAVVTANLVTLVGSVLWVVTSITTLQTEVKQIRSDVDRLRDKADMSASRERTRVDQSPAPAPSAEVSPLVPEAPPPPAQAIAPIVPNSIAPREPPACVHRKFRSKFSCERATNCVGAEGYKASFFAEIRAVAGVTGDMLVCDER